jgi:hypothetical protein
MDAGCHLYPSWLPILVTWFLLLLFIAWPAKYPRIDLYFVNSSVQVLTLRYQICYGFKKSLVETSAQMNCRRATPARALVKMHQNVNIELTLRLSGCPLTYCAEPGMH